MDSVVAVLENITIFSNDLAKAADGNSGRDVIVDAVALDRQYGALIHALFGHYWRTWPVVELLANAACLDYSAVNGGPLVAYRWSGEASLAAESLVGIDRSGQPTLAGTRT